MTQGPDAETLIHSLLTRAKARGATAADAVMIGSEARATAIRLGRIEKLESEASFDLGLRIFQGARSVAVSTSDLSPASVERMLDQALAMVAAVPEDPLAGLAPAEMLAREIPSVDLADPEEPSPETLLERARAAEDTARAQPGITNSEGAEASWSRSQVVLGTSEGFLGRYALTRQGFSVAVVAGSGTGMERDYAWDSRSHGADLKAPERIGQEAAARAIARLGARQGPTGPVPVVFEPRVAAGLLRAFAGAINGANVARRGSFLAERMGERLFAPGIEIWDEPLIPRGPRSRPFDGEGLAQRDQAMVLDGVLQGWFLDLRSARQLGLRPSGHGSRPVGGAPSPSPSNLSIRPGKRSPEELIAGLAEGFCVTETLGHGVNLVTGDYSQGAAGFWIERGEKAWPVNEVTIAGSLLEIMAQIEPANDLERRTGIDSPTLLVSRGLTLAGA